MKVLKRSLLILLFLFVAYVAILFAFVGLPLRTWPERLVCRGKHATVQCAINHPFSFSLLRHEDSAVLHYAIEKVTDDPCNDIQYTSDTFTLIADQLPLNVHASEEAADLLDAVLLKSPECFLKASELMKPTLRLKLNYTFDDVSVSPEYSKSKSRGELLPFAKDPRYANSIRDYKVVESSAPATEKAK